MIRFPRSGRPDFASRLPAVLAALVDKRDGGPGNRYFDVSDWFGPPEQPGFYVPVFRGFFGSGASGIAGGRMSGPLGGLDGYGGGFKGPVGGIGGTIVGFNSGEGQGGPLGGLYSTLLGQAGFGESGFGGGGYFPLGLAAPYRFGRVIDRDVF